MRSNTLLERLAATQIREKTSEGALQLRLSILANLRRVLSTRQGHAAAQLDLGTPSPSEIIQDYPACIARLQQAVGVCVQKYEPRLTNIRVRHEVDESSNCLLRFHLYAEIADGLQTPLNCTTSVNARGCLELFP